jgi:hypothetical protein
VNKVKPSGDSVSLNRIQEEVGAGAILMNREGPHGFSAGLPGPVH